MKSKNSKFQKHKKSIASAVLASVLTFSFNFTPISLVANKLSNFAAAYKSSQTQTYYPNSSTSTESNIGTGKYPESLDKYFEGSSNNFNILSYYQARYADIFAMKVDEFLKNARFNDTDTNDVNSYNSLYKKYINYVGYTTLGEYYEAKAKTDLSSYETFTAYFEHFVTHEVSWTVVTPEGQDNENYTLPRLFDPEVKILEYFQPYVYNSLANYLTKTVDNIEESDGLSSTTKDFYEDSKQYLRVKSVIDTQIAETVAIYSYDNQTQNNYVAGIIATDAPTSMYYYYKDSTYELVNVPSISYEYGTYYTSSQQAYTHIRYFTFLAEADFSGLGGEAKTEYDSIKEYLTFEKESELENNPLYYRQVLPNEDGYIDSTHPIYTKYRSLPYVTTNSQYDIYVVSTNNISESMQATLDALYYFHTITQEELDADQYIFDNGGNNTGNLNPNRYYVQVPYSKTANNGQFYFDHLFSSYNRNEKYYNNLIEKILTDEYGNSKVYLKLREDTNKLVYIDKLSSGMTAAEFKAANSNYSYTVVDMDRTADDFNFEDYYEIDSNNFSSYKSGYSGNFPLYFKKEKVFYQELDTSDDVYEKNGSEYVYESKLVPNTEFELEDKPTEKFEKDPSNNSLNQLYVVGDTNINVTIGGNSYSAIAVSNDVIGLAENRNVYVKVPAYLLKDITVDGEYEFYYKHETGKFNSIYVVDKTEGAKDNEVYKNLRYNVITEDEYNSKYFNYVIIGSDDPNYNKNFKLYYKYAYDLTPPSANETNEYYEKLFIQNEITNSNAIYIIDDSLTSSDKADYKALYYTAITTAEYNANAEFYVQLSENEIKQFGDNSRYTKLYYKYVPSAKEENKIYIYSSSNNSTYNTFYNTDSDYNANDYVLIDPSDDNYVSGTDLYYKKIRTEKYLDGDIYKPTYYYYQATANVSVKANSYYAISFYVYTNGSVYNKTDTEKTSPVGDLTGSVYITDTTGTIENIEIENISTNGEWKQYYAFVSTDKLTASTLQLSFYMGDKNGIAGENQANDRIVSGSVLFDDIKITLINETDFNKKAIDDDSVLYKEPETPENPDDGTEGGETGGEGEGSGETGEPTNPPEGNENLGRYENQDKYGNEVIILEYQNNVRNNSIINKENNNFDWTDVFDFDNNALSFMTEGNDDNPSKSVMTELFNEYFAKNPNAIEYLDFSGDLTPSNWHYYISRNNSGLGNKNEFEIYKNSYEKGKVEVSVVKESSIDKTVKDEDKDDEEDKKPVDESDVKSVASTFINDNSVLKIKNTDRQRSLGVVSAPFVIEQNQYYKITVWVYSTDKDAKATIKAESYLSTEKTPNNGSLLSTTANVNAYLADYTTTPTNEYGWIPVTFYIEGNAYGDQEIYLALLADANDTIYFDNISIEKVTSSIYSTISSDSDATTYVLTLSPSTSLIARGITNGFFNQVNITDNYADIDYSVPRTAKNWTVQSTNSTYAIAGVVPTSKEYLNNTKNFYTEYNGGKYPFNENASLTERYANNVFAIYAPDKVVPNIQDASTQFAIKNNYKINTSSTSLSANGVYEISFNFIPGNNFNGNMVARLYAGSVEANRVIASFNVPYSSNSQSQVWDTYTFIVQNGLSSTSVYLEIGVEDATGTCFFEKVSNITSKYTSVNDARDTLLAEGENSSSDENDIYNKLSLAKYQFVDFKNNSLTIHDDNKNENGTYNSNEFTTSLENTSTYTVGKSGTVVASFYDKETYVDYYTVKISDKVTYYIKAEENTDSGEKTYKLYSDSVFTKEVDKIDGKEYEIVPSSSGKTLKLVVGNSKKEYEATAVNKTDYKYHFDEDVVIGDQFIKASELDNNISSNVMILANSLSTDYSSYSPKYTKTLSTSAYYVLKIYVKTSEIVSFDSSKESGLNINISSISTSWTNIDTSNVTVTEENNGFVCYQVLISTNKSSITSFGVQISLGTDKNSCSGYAIIAGITLDSFSSETLFNEYASTLDEDDNTIKRYYGETSSTNNNDDDDKDDEQGNSWATFFYIFSSLLLGIVLIVALVAVFVKKHPIKLNKKFKGNDDIVLTDNKPNASRKTKKSSLIEETEAETEPENQDDGFV